MTTLRTRATPIYRTEPIPPAVKLPPSYTMNGEVARVAELRLRKVIMRKSQADTPVEPRPMKPYCEPLPEPAMPLTLPQVYDRLLRVFDANPYHVASSTRKGLGGAKCWWSKPTICDVRQVMWAVMRSYETPTGTPSYPELAKLTRPGRASGGHSTIITSVRRWARNKETVERAMELARRAGLGESAVRRVRELADAEYAKRARVNGVPEAEIQEALK